MNFERAKSIILIILVGSSIFLTWSIWTYEPKYKKFDQSDYLKIESDKQIVSDVIKPVSILFHRDERHYLTRNPAQVDKIEREFLRWTFSSMKELSLKMVQKDFDDFVHENGSVEIQFSDDVPISLYKTVLDISDQEVQDFSFDRILIKQKDLQNQEAAVYFVSYDQQTIYQGMVPAKGLKAFMNDFYHKDYPEYTAHMLDGKKTIFVPKNQVKANRYQYYIDYLDIGNLKDALFMYPKYVRQESVARGEEYTDGTRLMTVNKENSLISYINPAQKSKVIGNPSDLLEKSIDFINDHAGWKEGNYRFAYMSENEQRVVFRLAVDGYPAFNEYGMTEIEEVWGKEEIYSYERPYFSLASALPSDDAEQTLPSGNEVLLYLKEQKNIDYSSIQDITVGYKLNKSLDSKLVTLMTLEPAWYYRIGDRWQAVPFEVDPGGDENGLE